MPKRFLPVLLLAWVEPARRTYLLPFVTVAASARKACEFATLTSIGSLLQVGMVLELQPKQRSQSLESNVRDDKLARSDCQDIG